MDEARCCQLLGDQELLLKLKALVAHERESLAGLLACLGEVDRRKLYADEGCPSMFAYCVQRLRYSESAAARRIHAARAARRFQEIYSHIKDGSISMSAVSMLAPYLTEENRHELLARAEGASKLELERMVAALKPREDTADRVRRLPSALLSPEASGASSTPSPQAGLSPAGSSASTEPVGAGGPELPRSGRISRDKLLPLAPGRIQFSFTASEDFLKDVERVRGLLMRKYPSGKLEDVFRETVEAFLEAHDPERRIARKAARRRAGFPCEAAARNTQQPTIGRCIPQGIKDEVWLHDEGQCSFIGPDGRRCAQRGGLEYDHILPWAMGGRSDDPGNIRLACRTHNQMFARRAFGKEVIEAAVEKRRQEEKNPSRHRTS
ncbi:MAG: HNH endonuclease [Elusimicrobia bacterium]|nr:HNH endonuclease [Elusimicrobiota bacterium]